MIITQSNKYGTQTIEDIGEITPLTDNDYNDIYKLLCSYIVAHAFIYDDTKRAHTFKIGVDGRDLPASVRCGQELMEWREHG